MKRITLNHQEVITQKVIDRDSNILVRFLRDGEKVGFQFVKFNFKEQIDPFFHSKLNWFFGYYNSIDQAEIAAIEYYNMLTVSA